MDNKVPLESLDSVRIPVLDERSEEEQLFEATETSSHSEHKLVKAQEAALGIAKERIRKLEIENDDLAMLGPHRRKYSWCILAFVVFFVSITFSILLLSSFEVATATSERPFRTLITLDNDVLMTLLATNTVQVVGLLYVVAKWLFPTKSVKRADT